MYTHKQVSNLVDLALLYGSTVGSDMTQEQANAWIALNHPEKEFAELEELTVFVPTHFLLDEEDNSMNVADKFKWEQVNEEKQDWLHKSTKTDVMLVQVITPGVARVIFVDPRIVPHEVERYDQGVYKYDIELSK